MPRLPDGDAVLTPASRGAYRLILFVAGWFMAGIATAVAAYSIAGRPARADQSVATELASIVHDIGEIQKDVAAIECRINMRNVCPPPR